MHLILPNRLKINHSAQLLLLLHPPLNPKCFKSFLSCCFSVPGDKIIFIFGDCEQGKINIATSIG